MTRIIDHLSLEIKPQKEIYAFLNEIEAYFSSLGLKERETELIDCSMPMHVILSSKMQAYDVIDPALASLYTKTVAIRAYIQEQAGERHGNSRKKLDILIYPESSKEG